MTKDQLYRYGEVVADIAYECGARRLRISNDSRLRIETMLSWAREFDERHKTTDWDRTDYIETIEAFIEEKLAEHQVPLDAPCPACGEKALLHESIEYPDNYCSVVCENCGKIMEDDDAQEFLRSTTHEEDGQESDLRISEIEGETIDIRLTPETYPATFERKVRCIMSGGMTRREAEQFVLTSPLCMELFYDIGRGLFAVEAEAVTEIPIYNPYTGKEILKEGD